MFKFKLSAQPFMHISQWFAQILGDPGDNAAMPTCCTIRSVDEAATLSEATQGKSKTGIVIPNPTHAADMAIATGTLTIGFMGVIAALNIFRHYQQKISDYKIARQKLKSYQPLTSEINRSSIELQKKQAYLKYHDQQIAHSRFEKWFAGVCSGSATIGVATGVIIKYATPVGLYLATAHSLARVAKNACEFIRAWRILNKIHQVKNQKSGKTTDDTRLQSLTIQQNYFKRTRKWAILNMVTWGLEAVGTGLMATMNLGAWGLSVKTGLAALPFLAPLIIITSTFGTLWTNNKITSEAYQPGLNTREINEIKQNQWSEALKDQNQIDLILIQENAKHEMYRNYKKFAFKNAPVGMKYRLTRLGLRLAGVATIGLAHQRLARKKRAVKELYTKRLATQFKRKNDEMILLQKRLWVLKQLHVAANPTTATTTTPTQNQPLQSLEQNNNDLVMTHTEKLERLIKSLDEVEERGQIFKLLAKKMLLPQKIANPYYTQEEDVWNNGEKEYQALQPEYQELQNKSLLVDLNKINQAKPCCSTAADAHFILEDWQDNLQNMEEKTQQKIYQALCEAVDQYLIFQMGKESNREIAKYSEIWQNF